MFSALPTEQAVQFFLFSGIKYTVMYSSLLRFDVLAGAETNTICMRQHSFTTSPKIHNQADTQSILAEQKSCLILVLFCLLFCAFCVNSPAAVGSKAQMQGSSAHCTLIVPKWRQVNAPCFNLPWVCMYRAGNTHVCNHTQRWRCLCLTSFRFPRASAQSPKPVLQNTRAGYRDF